MRQEEDSEGDRKAPVMVTSENETGTSADSSRSPQYLMDKISKFRIISPRRHHQAVDHSDVSTVEEKGNITVPEHVSDAIRPAPEAAIPTFEMHATPIEVPWIQSTIQKKMELLGERFPFRTYSDPLSLQYSEGSTTEDSPSEAEENKKEREKTKRKEEKNVDTEKIPPSKEFSSETIKKKHKKKRGNKPGSGRKAGDPGRWKNLDLAEKHVGDPQAYLSLALRDFLIYVIFVVVITTVALGTLNYTMYLYSFILSDVLTKTSFQVENNVTTSFREIRTIEQLWGFIDKVYLPTIHCKRPGGGATLKTTGDLLYVFENLVVGVPRIRQLRVTPDSCKIPSDFKEIFNQCYDYFSKKSESKEPFGPKAGTAWTYSEDLAQEYNGKVSSYTSGGFYYSFARDCFEIKKFLGELKDKKWIDEGTRAVFLDFSVYSPNVNLFCSSKLVAELPPSGGVVTQATFKTLKLIRYVTIWEHVILGVEMFIVVFICYFMFQELRKIRLFKWAYICMFWNLIDLSIVILSLVVVVVAIWRFLSVRSKLPAIVEIMKNEGHGNLDELATVQETFDILLGCLVALVWLKLLKYLMLCRTIYHILTTISRVVTELIGLIVILFMLLLSFALLAHLLYGSQVEEFGSLGSSITSLALLIIGALDYEKILNIRPVIGAIFFILFIFLYVLVFVSLLIAILVNGFATMRFEIMEDRHRIFMKQMFFKFLHWILSAFNLKQAAENVKKQAMSNKDKEDYRIIIEILRRSGFRGKEITAFLEKHNVVEGEPITDKKMQEVYSEIDTKGQLYMEAIEHEQIMSQVDVLKIRMNYIDKMTEEMAGKVELLLDKILHR